MCEFIHILTSQSQYQRHQLAIFQWYNNCDILSISTAIISHTVISQSLKKAPTHIPWNSATRMSYSLPSMQRIPCTAASEHPRAPCMIYCKACWRAPGVSKDCRSYLPIKAMWSLSYLQRGQTTSSEESCPEWDEYSYTKIFIFPLNQQYSKFSQHIFFWTKPC